MEIVLENLEKRFNQERIFTGLNYQMSSGNAYALVGSNGSGKSTLLQIISGFLLQSKGKVLYKAGKEIPVEDIYKSITIATPYMDLIEEFTLRELLEFHFRFKDRRDDLSIKEIINRAYLTKATDKFVKNFSSGMKQRLKLMLAFFSKSEIILLDEPTANLDAYGFKWYLSQIEQIREKLIIIASNEPKEYDFCQNIINLENFKRT